MKRYINIALSLQADRTIKLFKWLLCPLFCTFIFSNTILANHNAELDGTISSDSGNQYLVGGSAKKEKTCLEQGKVELCHIPPGNLSGAKTLCVSQSAANSHLSEHCTNETPQLCDTLGECDKLLGYTTTKNYTHNGTSIKQLLSSHKICPFWSSSSTCVEDESDAVDLDNAIRLYTFSKYTCNYSKCGELSSEDYPSSTTDVLKTLAIAMDPSVNPEIVFDESSIGSKDKCSFDSCNACAGLRNSTDDLAILVHLLPRVNVDSLAERCVSVVYSRNELLTSPTTADYKCICDEEITKTDVNG